MKRQLIRTGEIETFSRSVFRLSLSCSTASITAAPREAASRAIIPEPVKMSRNERPLMFPRQAKTDSLILSMLGLIMPAGTAIVLPLRMPPVILTLFMRRQAVRLVRRCSLPVRSSLVPRACRILQSIFVFYLNLS